MLKKQWWNINNIHKKVLFIDALHVMDVVLYAGRCCRTQGALVLSWPCFSSSPLLHVLVTAARSHILSSARLILSSVKLQLGKSVGLLSAWGEMTSVADNSTARPDLKRNLPSRADMSSRAVLWFLCILLFSHQQSQSPAWIAEAFGCSRRTKGLLQV